jgi:hypothetical protein
MDMVPYYEVPGLGALVPRRPVSDRKVRQLVGTRLKLISRELPKMRLPKLDETECLAGESSWPLSLRGNPESVTAPKGLSLQTRGLFKLQPYEAIEYLPNSGFQPPRGEVARPNGTKRLWGLTENGDWVVVTIEVVGEPGYKRRGRERAASIVIEKVTLNRMLAITKAPATQVWCELGQLIKRYAAQRYQEYRDAKELADVVEAENLVYNHLTSAP